MASYARCPHPPATASHKLPLGEQGMELDLVDYWLDGCNLQHPVYLTQAKVCHPQMPDLTLPHQLLHGLPAPASPVHDTKPIGHIDVAILTCCCRLDNCRSDPCHSLFQVHLPQQAFSGESLKSRLNPTWKVVNVPGCLYAAFLVLVLGIRVPGFRPVHQQKVQVPALEVSDGFFRGLPTLAKLTCEIPLWQQSNDYEINTSNKMRGTETTAKSKLVQPSSQ